ncbi:MAG: ABC transporter ATP-binding protein [Chloroflexi bacterium CFX1]|nr:ABC transporter ATP-binding protein [Chloroflexi bacterium CFX1]MCK6568563.1 ABC transporter ATP-binding protein [Anaerolineales bacterium]MCQ3952582.1 spermidine/putrescine ABC transporter ATP-binding protein [Chloroflexota bacterium]MDL1919062.1 ABC transporter ATP-binding protein [Chloroflexi bacterium CFX5]NUQ60135.1 ABC transporter ATP-binding protein [Anaerolineales bacterium]
MNHLTLSNISKSFDGAPVVKDFNLEIEKGEFVSFLGPSGCGKTTTLRMVAGFETPTSGQILLDGADITDKAPNQRNVGMIFQSYALFPNMTVAQNIGFGLQIRKESRSAIKERVAEMLALINLEKHAHKFPYQLSGGQQQRVSLARALAIHPQVLLLDEPLSALDAKIRVSLRSEIRAIQRKLGITAIFVTHDQEEALSISDRIVVMNAGEMEQVGTPFEIYNFPQTQFVANFVGSLNNANAEIADPGRGLLNLNGVQFITATDIKSKSKGDKVRISVRPERFSFVAEQRKDNVLDCVIENITFLGSVVRIQVSIGGAKFNMDTFNNPFLELPKIGAKEQVTCSKEAVLVLDE